ncbi:MAG: DUF1643 domain-containing protein [Pseudomonadota bacterium]
MADGLPMNRDLLEERGAAFNEARTHRQRLWRIWDRSKPLLYSVGMNPSKADEVDNDPTVTRDVKRATQLGYGGVIKVNMQDVVETDSRKLDRMPIDQRCTSANVSELKSALDAAQRREADILCCWGRPGQKHGPVAWFTTQAARRGVTLFCLGMNKDGSPEHSLYVPYSRPFQWFAGVDAADAARPLVVAHG